MCIYIYIEREMYIYIYIHVYTYIYIYIFLEAGCLACRSAAAPRGLRARSELYYSRHPEYALSEPVWIDVMYVCMYVRG